jgi:hypothetical protein
VIELPAAMAGARLDDGRKMVPFMAPHRSHDGDIVDHAAHVWEPIGNGNSGFAIASERPLTGDYRPFHLRLIIAETDRIDELAGPLVVLRIERVDMTYAATHEQEDHRLCLSLELRC